ncbi:MAG: Na/Pi cotransporter family protein [Lachnospiraceae bacterium]
MGVQLVLSLLGGLALFLYGMQMMSSNLEAVAGNRMKEILEKLTANRFLGVLVGAVITAVIQSSSATTVMVVGFVNSGLMTLNQAVWIIMGANIGTTITGQLIALDISAIAPLIAFVGVFLVVFIKDKKTQYVGGIIAGLGVLFIGMGMMGDAMVPLRESQSFVDLMTRFQNPLLGILAGAVFTAVIQSSSASVGILQALAMSGLIGLDGAVFVLFGQNIGTCITAVLASIGTSRNAKRTTIIHLMFNIIGTVVFVIITLVTPFVDWMTALRPGDPVAQIANVHTIFNITTTVLLLPVGGLLAKAATIILPDKKTAVTDEDKWFEDLLKTQHVLGFSTMIINSLQEEMKEMMALAAKNVEQSFNAISQGDTSIMDEITAREDEIDIWNVKLSKKVSRVLTVEQSFQDIDMINHIYKIVGNLERIGDHAMNLAEYAVHMKEKELTLSPAAMEEVLEMKGICMRALDELLNLDAQNRMQILGEMIVFEQQIDDTNRAFRQNQLNRLRKSTCNVETSILYSEMLTDYERIGDHILNIAKAYAGVEESEHTA